MKIKEVIVVEGKNDSKRLKSFFDVDTIETSGSGLSKNTLDYIKEINETRGVILFLDPDMPGEKIRNKINSYIPDLKNAFVLKEEARTSKKVGVEHASKEVLLEALNNLITYKEYEESISYEDFYELGLSGKENSNELRLKVSKEYHLGKCNSKTLYKRLNMLGKTKADLKKIL